MSEAHTHRRTMKATISLLTVILLNILIAGCNEEDDIDEIFCNGTFKITGVTSNGVKIVKDISELYEQDGTYLITFNRQTFQGTLLSGTHIEGTWQADGKDGSFSMKFGSNTDVESSSSSLQQKIYQILINASHYSGDTNVLRLHDNKDSYIELRRI